MNIFDSIACSWADRVEGKLPGDFYEEVLTDYQPGTFADFHARIEGEGMKRAAQYGQGLDANEPTAYYSVYGEDEGFPLSDAARGDHNGRYGSSVAPGGQVSERPRKNNRPAPGQLELFTELGRDHAEQDQGAPEQGNLDDSQ